MDQASRLASALPSTRQHAPFRSASRRLRGDCGHGVDDRVLAVSSV